MNTILTVSEKKKSSSLALFFHNHVIYDFRLLFLSVFLPSFFSRRHVQFRSFSHLLMGNVWLPIWVTWIVEEIYGVTRLALILTPPSGKPVPG